MAKWAWSPRREIHASDSSAPSSISDLFNTRDKLPLLSRVSLSLVLSKAMMFRLVLVLLLAASSLAQTAEGYRQQAIKLSQKKAWDEAIANYRQAIALDPNDALTHYNLGLALKYKGNAPQAIEEFQAALRIKPKWGDAHYALGAAFYDLNDSA